MSTTVRFIINKFIERMKRTMVQDNVITFLSSRFSKDVYSMSIGCGDYYTYPIGTIRDVEEDSFFDALSFRLTDKHDPIRFPIDGETISIKEYGNEFSLFIGKMELLFNAA